MGRFDKYYEAQEFILDIVRKELVGPVDENEVIEVYPIHTYVTGILWPKRNKSGEDASEPRNIGLLDLPSTEDESEDDAAVDNLMDIDDEISTGAVNTAAVRKPSTMGISCILADDEKSVKVIFKYAKYIHSEEEVRYGENNEKKKVIHKFERKPEIVELEFDFSRERLQYKPIDSTSLDGKGIEIIATSRRRNKSGKRLITFTVTNLVIAAQKEIPESESTLFQCELRLIASKPFLAIEQEFSGEDIEGQILRMQYRTVKNFAQGHGCAARATNHDNPREIISCFVPTVEVNQMKSLESADEKLFSLQYLYTASKSEIIEKLKAFLGSYRDFRASENTVSARFTTFKAAAKKSIENIDTCIARIEKGIEVLATNSNAWRAFTLCNKSMREQRISMDLKKGKIATRAEFSGDPKWYPFQLFYLIMIIPDIAGGNGNFNDAVDLLYFPTGGGKTEAYLAVSAFIIFYERITKPQMNHGVTVLMRYTLRLLTIQQFERAAALICACEDIRKAERMGDSEISIGLWIGGESSPNRIKSTQTSKGAAEILEMIKAEEYVASTSNPIQITACPHCGKSLDATNYFTPDQAEMIIKCPNGCFGNNLPIYIVDDDIYNKRPTLVISTVDKFARIVWEERTSALFGGTNSNPPRLIIQDELHLISGPLGTLTGIYESAVDKLCCSGTHKPKVIASTATVKRSKYQIKNLYNRDIFQFPPNGIDSTSSFFAERATRDERPVRTYIGITEQGGSMLDLFLRTFSAVSLANYLLYFKKTDLSIIDHYYTMVGYFNALRDLGTSSTALRERMEAHIDSLLNTKFKRYADVLGLPKYKYTKKIKVSEEGEKDRFEEKEIVRGYQFNLFPPHKEPRQTRTAELTSRRSAFEIKKILDHLNIALTDTGVGREDLVYNYVLASNMFSVGVDIDRLGTMLVYGQPKSNSEYIQSTSRVGRSNPGIVFAGLNSFRSRDRSFYENFYDYHNNFYKYVEATSVTPFSIRSIEKALHSVFVALVRHTVPGLNTNRGASNFRKTNPTVIALRAYLLERINQVQPAAVKFATEYLDNFIKSWDEYEGGKLVYDIKKEGRGQGNYIALLTAAEEEDDTAYKTLNSVRNVDSSSNIFVRR
ncbi:MAG: helicase C-terminal domain-containing protein [Firmicutes bacterium]|nr:helicase C-terminal domain-containing protein [Bacillota bacterium]